jgi:type I restriction enzyme M protein
MRVSETRTESVAKQLLDIRGWKTTAPPRGNLLWKNEYRNYPHLLSAMAGQGKKGHGGDAYPDFIVVDNQTHQPIIVGEVKAKESDIDLAIHEASDLYGEAFRRGGLNVLAAGIAGDDNGNIAVRITKRGAKDWQPIAYRSSPIQWIPSPDEAGLLLADNTLFDLQPRVPSPEVLAKTGEEINRALRECKIKDDSRPAIMGALMLSLWWSKGNIRIDPEHVLHDINEACRTAFIKAGKSDIADSLLVPTDNAKLAAQAPRIIHTLRLLNITTLTAEHPQ